MTDISYKLWDAASNYVDIGPRWESAEGREKNFSLKRSTSGNLSIYTHGTWRRFSFKYNFIPASVAAVVNSWFDERQLCQLEITDELATQVFSVQIVNTDTPFQEHAISTLDYFKGRLNLSEY